MKYLYQPFYAALLCVLLVGCQALGLTQPQSFEDRVQYVRSGVSGAYKTIGDLKAARSITAAQGIVLFNKTERVETSLDEVETIAGKGDVSTAEGKLTLALAGLTAVQTELRAHGAK